MQPCTECGTIIKKKDSFLRGHYICSQECKTSRKSKLPKKLSITSSAYWVKQGYSEVDAKAKVSELQKQRSPRSIEYWLKKGCSYDEAVNHVSEVQRKNGLQNLVKYTREERLMRTPFAVEYWVNKGMTQDEAEAHIRQQSSTISLPTLINKYGEDEGTRRYTEMCEYRQQHYTLDGFIQKHGEKVGLELWSRKFKHRSGSAKADEFFSSLITEIKDVVDSDIFTATNENGEFSILHTNNQQCYFYDFVIPDLNLCVEYNGDYWHCNPTMYKPTHIHPERNITAAEIWHTDLIKEQYMTDKCGFTTITVWESDDVTNAINNIKGIILNESTKSKN